MTNSDWSTATNVLVWASEAVRDRAIDVGLGDKWNILIKMKSNGWIHRWRGIGVGPFKEYVTYIWDRLLCSSS